MEHSKEPQKEWSACDPLSNCVAHGPIILARRSQIKKEKNKKDVTDRTAGPSNARNRTNAYRTRASNILRKPSSGRSEQREGSKGIRLPHRGAGTVHLAFFVFVIVALFWPWPRFRLGLDTVRARREGSARNSFLVTLFHGSKQPLTIRKSSIIQAPFIASFYFTNTHTHTYSDPVF